jgi:Tfp pilus assembly protein PilO
MKLFNEGQANQFLNRYYRYLSLILILVIIIIGYFSLLLPQYRKLKDTGIFENKEAENMLAEREQYLADLREMRQAYDELEIRAWRSLDNILPAEDEIYLLFAQMEVFARDNNLILTSININDGSIDAAATGQSVANKAIDPSNVSVKPADNIRTVSLSLNLTGINSYENFKQFLDSIENNVRILDLRSLAYSPGNNTYTVTLTTYYLYE